MQAGRQAGWQACRNACMQASMQAGRTDRASRQGGPKSDKPRVDALSTQVMLMVGRPIVGAMPTQVTPERKREIEREKDI